jgi:hypothetical protein
VQRVLAVLGAVGMVVAAVLIRQALDDDDPADADPGDVTVVICAEDLRDQCEALGDDVEVRSEAAATTAAAIDAGTVAADVDAWITSTAWLEVVDARAPAALGDRRALATSPTVVATAPGRYDAITDLCAGDDVWSCLGDAAGSDWADLGDGTHPEWRELKVGLTDPDSAAGLSGLAAASAGFFGTTDFAANDPAFAEFEGWLANLAEPSAAGDPNPAETLATRPGTYSAAGSIAAIADGYDERGVESIDPDPPVAATAVVAALGGRGLPDTDRIADSLVDAGWARAGEDALAPTLKPGVMAALLTLWEAVTR